jgi:hypothetical protein
MPTYRNGYFKNLITRLKSVYSKKNKQVILRLAFYYNQREVIILMTFSGKLINIIDQ